MHKHDIGNECVKNNKLGRVLRSLCEYTEYIGQDILKNVFSKIEFADIFWWVWGFFYYTNKGVYT